MNDRYLYRAKRTDNGEWEIGSLVLSDDADDEYKAIIIPSVNSNMFTRESYNEDLGFENWYKVDPSTICQCTGLKDKNGKLVFENDVVKGKYYDNGKSHRHIGQVKYIYEAYKVVGVKQYTGYHAHLDGSYEVIGNIFDNKELLESEDKDENNY